MTCPLSRRLFRLASNGTSCILVRYFNESGAAAVGATVVLAFGNPKLGISVTIQLGAKALALERP